MLHITLNSSSKHFAYFLYQLTQMKKTIQTGVCSLAVMTNCVKDLLHTTSVRYTICVMMSRMYFKVRCGQRGAKQIPCRARFSPKSYQKALLFRQNQKHKRMSRPGFELMRNTKWECSFLSEDCQGSNPRRGKR